MPDPENLSFEERARRLREPLKPPSKEVKAEEFPWFPGGSRPVRFGVDLDTGRLGLLPGSQPGTRPAPASPPKPKDFADWLLGRSSRRSLERLGEKKREPQEPRPFHGVEWFLPPALRRLVEEALKESRSDDRFPVSFSFSVSSPWGITITIGAPPPGPTVKLKELKERR